jgi:hypothetical protein
MHVYMYCRLLFKTSGLIHWNMYIYINRGCGSSFSIVLPTDWATRFVSSTEANDFSSNLFQTSSEAHPAPYPMGPRGPFLGVKRGMTLTTQPHPVPR